MPCQVGLAAMNTLARARASARRHAWSVPSATRSLHRTGTWCDPSQGVYVGWSVQKDAFVDGMPLSSERGDPTLVLSGEP